MQLIGTARNLSRGHPKEKHQLMLGKINSVIIAYQGNVTVYTLIAVFVGNVIPIEEPMTKVIHADE